MRVRETRVMGFSEWSNVCVSVCYDMCVGSRCSVLIKWFINYERGLSEWGSGLEFGE